MATINVYDNLYREAVDVAKLQVKTVEQFFSETLRHAIGQAAPQAAVARRTIRNRLPVIVFNGTAPAVDLRAVREAIEEKGFSPAKSLKHHTAMQSLFQAWYNLARKHEALKGQTPAMASGLAGHVWTIKELIEKAGQ